MTPKLTSSVFAGTASWRCQVAREVSQHYQDEDRAIDIVAEHLLDKFTQSDSEPPAAVRVGKKLNKYLAKYAHVHVSAAQCAALTQPVVARLSDIRRMDPQGVNRPQQLQGMSLQLRSELFKRSLSGKFRIVATAQEEILPASLFKATPAGYVLRSGVTPAAAVDALLNLRFHGLAMRKSTLTLLLNLGALRAALYEEGFDDRHADAAFNAYFRTPSTGWGYFRRYDFNLPRLADEIINSEVSIPAVSAHLSVSDLATLWLSRLKQLVILDQPQELAQAAVLEGVRIATDEKVMLCLRLSGDRIVWQNAHHVHYSPPDAVSPQLPPSDPQEAQLTHHMRTTFINMMQSEFPAHPQLSPRGSRWRIVEDDDIDSNCVGHALGKNEFMWPGESLQDFDALLHREGFVRLKKLDFRRVSQIEKVVVFGMNKTHPKYRQEANLWTRRHGRREPHKKVPRYLCMHLVRQEADGTYTSKVGMGFKPVIRVADPVLLGNSEPVAKSDGSMHQLFSYYGAPIAVYARCRDSLPTCAGGQAAHS